MEQNNKSALFDLAIVLLVAFLVQVIHSVYMMCYGTVHVETDYPNLQYFLFIVEEALAILLLCYVLYNRDKSIWDLGIKLHPKEILFGIGLYFLADVFDLVAFWILYYSMPEEFLEVMTPKHVGIPVGLSPLVLVLFLLLTPFYEELIVRGFAMSQIFSLTNSKTMAVSLSILIQCSYHLYQGFFPALRLAATFLCYAVFYMETKRLTPVIVAHFIQDLILLRNYSALFDGS